MRMSFPYSCRRPRPRRRAHPGGSILAQAASLPPRVYATGYAATTRRLSRTRQFVPAKHKLANRRPQTIPNVAARHRQHSVAMFAVLYGPVYPAAE